MRLDDINEGLKDAKDNPCWKGYHPVGTKEKDGRTVPNCVPKESVDEADMSRRGFLGALAGGALAAAGLGAAGNAIAGPNDPGFSRKVQEKHFEMIEKNPRYAKEHADLNITIVRGMSGASAENNKQWTIKTAQLLQKYGVKVNEGVAEGSTWKDSKAWKSAVGDFDRILSQMERDNPEAEKKHQQGVKQRIKTNPIAGPKGTLPEGNRSALSQAVAEAGTLDRYRDRIGTSGQSDRYRDRQERRHERDQEYDDASHQSRLNRLAADDQNYASWRQNQSDRDAHRTTRMQKDDDDWEKTFDMMRDRINRYQWSSQRDVDPEQLAAISNIKYEPKKKNEAVQAKTDDKLLAYYAQRKAEEEKKKKEQQGVAEAGGRRYTSYHDELSSRERAEQDYMDQSKRDFKRAEMQHELGHEDDPNFERNLRQQQMAADRGPWYIRIDGKIYKQKGVAKSFDWKRGANNYALAMIKNNPSLQGKIMLSKSAEDK